jgi:DNA recombination protein RmuC
MQSPSPAGGKPAEPAREGAPAQNGGEDSAITLAEPKAGAVNDAALTAWGAVAAFLFVFLIVFYFITRWRIGGNPARLVRKTGDTASEGGFFQPAGEGAEITFEDAPMQDRRAPAVPKPKRPFFNFGRAKEARDEVGTRAHEEEIELRREDEAEVVIENRGAAAKFEAPVAPKPKPASPFSRLFAKKKEEEDAIASAPPLEDEETTVEIIHGDAEPEPASAAKLSQTVFGAARNEENDWRRRLEDERRADAERAEAERRAAEEREMRERERLAEREAEFERRKLAASAEQQRLAAVEARERRANDPAAMRAEISREYDARIAELQQRLDRLQRPTLVQPPQEASLRELDQRIARLSDREPRFLGGAAGEGDDRLGELLARRLADHQNAINASLEAMSQRIDTLAGAPQDVRALRDEIASLKRALGERVSGPNAPLVQLSDIIRNAMPPDSYEFRAMLANNRKADCLIRLPYPPGPIAIDARFPVEAFAKLHGPGADNDPAAENEFRRAALRHIVDIAERLIVPDATAESALMFIPSETMYAELHARFPDVVQDSYRARVWIVSPTSLMATLHTLRAVLRDAKARESAELIQTEAGHVLSEVDALRRRVFSLEESFNRVRNDFRDLVTSSDQVYRRAETISNSRRFLGEEPRRQPAGPAEEQAPVEGAREPWREAHREDYRDAGREPQRQAQWDTERESAREAPRETYSRDILAAPAAPVRETPHDERRTEDGQRQPFPLR